MEYKRPRYYKLKELGYKKIGGSTKWCKVMEQNYYLIIDAETFEYQVLCEKKFDDVEKHSIYLEQVKRDVEIVSLPEKNYEMLYELGWYSTQVGCEIIFRKSGGCNTTQQIKFDKIGKVEQSWIDSEDYKITTPEESETIAKTYKNLQLLVRNLMINLAENKIIFDIKQNTTFEQEDD